MKKIRIHPAVAKELKKWPIAVKLEIADLLGLLADGESLSMPVSRAMPSVAKGAHELRVKDQLGQYRTFYVSKYEDALYVFHAFKKKSQTTPKKEIETAKQRLKDLL